MKTKKLTVVVFLVVALLLLSVTAALARPELAQFTLQNKGDYTVYVTLYEATELRHSAQDIEYPAVPAGAFYYVSVGPKETKTITVDRALYFYTLSNLCGGKTLSGPIDLANGGKITIPSACLTYYPTYEEKLTLDGVMEANTLVAFSFENTTSDTLFVTMTGPQELSFFLEPFQTRDFSVEEGEYSYQYQCKGAQAYFVKSVMFRPYFHWTYLLDCD